jgi:hypothetical protein
MGRLLDAALGAVAGVLIGAFVTYNMASDRTEPGVAASEKAEPSPAQASTSQPAQPVVAPTPPAPEPGVIGQGITRTELIAILSSFGMTVKDSTAKESDPWLSARTPKGTDFYVNMYDCVGTGADSRRCNNLQFLAQWELTQALGLDSANIYNQKFVFGRAYLNKDGKMFMFDYSIKIKDGVTKDNLKRHVDNWLMILDDIRSLLKV